MNAEEFFHEFFPFSDLFGGGGMYTENVVYRGRDGAMYVRRRRRPRRPPPGFRRPDGQPDEMGQRMMQLLQLLPIALLLLFTLFNSGSREEALFSLDRGRDFPVEMRTNGGLSALHRVTPSLPYFVTSEQYLRYSRDRHLRYQVERRVEAAMQDRLQKRCFSERSRKRRLWYQMQRAPAAHRDSLLQQHDAETTPSCFDLQDLAAKKTPHSFLPPRKAQDRLWPQKEEAAA